MEFCATCGMLLQYEPARAGGKARLYCPTCPYVYTINRKIVKKQALVRKEEGAILNKDDSKKSASKSDNEICPKCRGTGAYFHEMQTRSADEPMTIFYTCCNEACKHTWVEN